MSEALYSAVAGAVAATRTMEVVSNNVANVSSTGFKGDRVSFREVLANAGRRDVSSVEVSGVEIDFSPGLMRDTGRSLDVSIEGPGFFSVRGESGERYTRSGSFVVSSEGFLTTPDGLKVLSEGDSPVSVGGAPGSARIAEDGTVFAGSSAVGKLKVVDFQNPQLLRREGANLWSASARAQPEAVLTRVRPKTVEGANVNPVSAMTELVMVSRAYEQFHSALAMFRAVDQKLVNGLR